MIDLSSKSETSRVLSFLRLPLAVLVVFIHTSFPSDKNDLAFYIGTFLSQELASIAVPAFFLISGYLFFAKSDRFGWREYSESMRKKSISLAVPYFLWIAIVFYGYGALTGFTNNPSPSDFYRIFWANGDGFMATSIFGYRFSILSSPGAMGVLWFIRDLMVVMLLTPVFWWIAKRLGIWAIVIYLIPYFLFIAVPLHGFGLTALCFFPIGATLSICGRNICKDLTNCRGGIYLIFAVILTIKFTMDIQSMTYHRIIGQLLILAGIPAFVMAAKDIMGAPRLTRITTLCVLLGETSFFIYVCHALPVFNPVNRYAEMLQSIPHVGFTVYYFGYWMLRIVIVMAIYHAMKRYCPRVLSVLVGGRLPTKVKSYSGIEEATPGVS